MREVMIEFPVIGYAEVTIEVTDDMTSDEILKAIEDGTIDVVYDGHNHAESLHPMFDVNEARNMMDMPLSIAVVE